MRSKTWFLRMASIFALLMGAQPALASNNSAGQITYLQTRSNGIVIFYMTGTRTTPPACATQARWTFDANSTGGQAMLATLLTAYARRDLVAVWGTGTCLVWSDTETVSFMQITP